jgi:hypothetical protein
MDKGHGLPERVRNYRPRDTVEIISPWDTLPEKPRPNLMNVEIPTRDRAMDSILYRDPWILERSRRIREALDSSNADGGQAATPERP